MILGAIADDLTGATDLALTLAREGMRTIQLVGVPEQGFDFETADAVVVALKSRTIPAGEAVAQSLAALRFLQAGGARQIVFKYCSTFDSTPAGNIGPVAGALLEALGGAIAVACPAFPANGRTIYLGHLFVGRQLLSDSPMKDHPLTPMTSSNLVGVLQAQTQLQVGLVPYPVVTAGAVAVRSSLDVLAAEGVRLAIVDAVTDDHLRAIGAAVVDAPLVTGGSGVAIGLPAAYRARGWLAEASAGDGFPTAKGPGVILAGSCSAATRRQVATAVAAGVPTLQVDPVAIAEGRTTAEDAVAFVAAAKGIALVASSDEPEAVRRAQERLGRDEAGRVVEDFHATVARLLRERGWRRFIVAGGETAGAVVAALGVTGLRIGPEIDPGVPWTTTVATDVPLTLALKSGNFGAADFFLKAWNLLP